MALKAATTAPISSRLFQFTARRGPVRCARVIEAISSCSGRPMTPRLATTAAPTTEISRIVASTPASIIRLRPMAASCVSVSAIASRPIWMRSPSLS